MKIQKHLQEEILAKKVKIAEKGWVNVDRAWNVQNFSNVIIPMMESLDGALSFARKTVRISFFELSLHSEQNAVYQIFMRIYTAYYAV